MLYWDKRKKEEPGAYFTVEMSLVFPIVLFVMVLLIHFTFYLYGRCILSQDTYLIAFRASILRGEAAEDRTGYIEGIAGTQFGNKYFGHRIPSLEIEAGDKEVVLHAETEASHRAMSASDLMPVGSWVHGAGARAEIIDPAARIRRIDRIGDVAKGLYESAKDKGGEE